MKPVYWQALAVVMVMYFARFDWSFVVLRAKQVRLRPCHSEWIALSASTSHSILCMLTNALCLQTAEKQEERPYLDPLRQHRHTLVRVASQI